MTNVNTNAEHSGLPPVAPDTTPPDQATDTSVATATTTASASTEPEATAAAGTTAPNTAAPRARRVMRPRVKRLTQVDPDATDAGSVPTKTSTRSVAKAPRKTRRSAADTVQNVATGIPSSVDTTVLQLALHTQSLAKAGKPIKPVKVKKNQLVSDSFTLPKAEFAVLAELKQRAVSLAQPVKKSGLIRAGIKALAALPDTAFVAALNLVPAIKTGRPGKG